MVPNQSTGMEFPMGSAFDRSYLGHTVGEQGQAQSEFEELERVLGFQGESGGRWDGQQ